MMIYLEEKTLEFYDIIINVRSVFWIMAVSTFHKFFLDVCLYKLDGQGINVGLW